MFMGASDRGVPVAEWSYDSGLTKVPGEWYLNSGPWRSQPGHFLNLFLAQFSGFGSQSAAV